MANAVVALLAMGLPAPFVLRRAAFRDRGAVIALVLITVADVGNMGLYFGAIGRGPVALAVLSHYLAPILVAVAAPLVAEPAGRRALLAAPAALFGLALLVGPPREGFPIATVLLGAGSAVFYAVIV